MQSLGKHQSREAAWRRGGRGSCVFLVEERSFRALRPAGIPAALAPLCGTLWRVSAGTASHTSWWEPSGHLIDKRKWDRGVIKWRQMTWHEPSTVIWTVNSCTTWCSNGILPICIAVLECCRVYEVLHKKHRKRLEHELWALPDSLCATTTPSSFSAVVNK